MSHKPEHELWVVILNEFTDAGIDALSVAQSAHGSFDVRLVAGGCLCCVGQLDFGKQLREILRTLKPARLLIEPSGPDMRPTSWTNSPSTRRSGHWSSTAWSVWWTLSTRAGSCAPVSPENGRKSNPPTFCSCRSRTGNAVAQQAFHAIAAEQYPAKRYVGVCNGGDLRRRRLLSYSRAAGFFVSYEHQDASPPIVMEFSVAGLAGSETHTNQLGLWRSAGFCPVN